MCRSSGDIRSSEITEQKLYLQRSRISRRRDRNCRASAAAGLVGSEELRSRLVIFPGRHKGCPKFHDRRGPARPWKA